MKVVSTIILCVMAVAFLSSCDANKSKAKDIASEFIQTVKDDDKAGYCELYPALRGKDDIEFVTDLNDDDLDANEIQEGLYEVSLGNGSTIVVKIDGDDSKIVDSHEIIDFPKVYEDIASKTGMPLNKLSDKKILEMLSDDGAFTLFLASKNWNYNSLFLSVSNGRYNWGMTNGAYYCNMTNNVTNDGKKRVSGNDYEIIHTVKRNSTGEELRKVTTYGQDVEAGCTITTQNDIKDLYSIACDRDLSWTSEIKAKRGKLYLLNKYCTFNGDEYSKFDGKVEEE